MTNADQFAPRVGMTESEIDATVETILREATLEEKVAMMSGRGAFQQMAQSGWGGDPYRAGGGCERLGVPALFFTDGPRGVVRGRSTCFPVTMARGASWDADLERRIGEAMGIEARAQGCTLSGAVCVNLLRHPAWGRAQETYGEDPYHVGEMGAALAEGIQTHNVVATAKHFALNSIENARFKVNVRIDERSLREVYLAHFQRILGAGCASVMSAYNKVNGEYCGQNRTLLTDILRHEWGFEGFVHSDWGLGVHHPYGAAAGLDVENPEPIHFGKKLVAAVEGGQIEPAVIDTACRRILRTTYRFACAEDPLESYGEALVACPAHRAIALEAAEKSAVLLTNGALSRGARGVCPSHEEGLSRGARGVCPSHEEGLSRGARGVCPSHEEGLSRGARGASPSHEEALSRGARGVYPSQNERVLPLSKTADVAVFGRLAARKNTGDHGSSAVRPPYVVTALDGIAEALERPGMALSGDESDPSAAAEQARSADAAVVVVGYTANEEGEYIPADHAAIIDGPDEVKARGEAVGGTQRPAPSAGRGGDRSSLRLPADQVALIRAVAEANARTIVVIVAGSAVIVSDWAAAVASILQTFYSGMEGGRALAALLFGEVSPSGKLPFTVAAAEDDYPFFDRDADVIDYGPYHGYSLFERERKRAHFPFGHGLSYGKFVYRGLKARRKEDGLAVEISVRNDGEVSADEVSQLYVGFPGTAIDRPIKLLRGFQRTRLQPGERRTLRFKIPLAELKYWCPISRSWQLEHGEYTVHVGGSSDASCLKQVAIAL